MPNNNDTNGGTITKKMAALVNVGSVLLAIGLWIPVSDWLGFQSPREANTIRIETANRLAQSVSAADVAQDLAIIRAEQKAYAARFDELLWLLEADISPTVKAARMREMRLSHP